MNKRKSITSSMPMGELSDNRWSLLSAVAYAASAVVSAIVDARQSRHDVELHERLAAMEIKIDKLEKANVKEA